MNLPVMLDLAHREIPDVQSVVVRQGESGALTLKIAIVENKKPFDLTGYEAYLKAARPDGAVISQPCTIEQPTKGCVSYTLPPEIAGVVGKISLAHVEIRKSDTLIATTDDLSILVRPCVDMDAAEAKSVVSEIDRLKELLHGIIDDGSAQLASQSSEFTALKSESQAATTAANDAAANADASTSSANSAAATANESASGALSAAQAANTAASNANTAKDNADTAATNANAATAASATQTAVCAAATDAAMDVATTALSKRRADTLYANALIGNAQGDMVHVEDAWGADAVGLGVLGKSVQDGTPTPDVPVEIDVVDSPVTVKVADGSQALINQQTITLPLDHDYLASLPDGTRDELVLRADGVAVLTERVGKAVFDGSADEVWTIYSVNDNGLTNFRMARENTPADLAIFNQVGAQTAYINDRFPEENVPITSAVNEAMLISNRALYLRISTSRFTTVADFRTWLAANPVTVYYELKTPATSYSADNGTTWSTTDPSAGNSAIQLYKGTNNVWCTDPLSPEVSLDYVQDTNKVINELRAAIVASGATN